MNPLQLVCLIKNNKVIMTSVKKHKRENMMCKTEIIKKQIE